LKELPKESRILERNTKQQLKEVVMVKFKYEQKVENEKKKKEKSR
jgi:7-cyano-7-deazaguanine synthase in queuosine biosynthesis